MRLVARGLSYAEIGAELYISPRTVARHLQSIYAKLGLSNGDTIHSINGFELDSLDKGLEVYQKVRDASGLQVSVTRRGKPMTINYSIK